MARTFALCCTALGFKVRVWRLASHTLTEIFIADKFIIFDGDPLAKSYYLDPNNDSQLLGVEDMWGFTEEEFIELNILSKPIEKNIKKKQVKNNI